MNPRAAVFVDHLDAVRAVLAKRLGGVVGCPSNQAAGRYRAANRRSVPAPSPVNRVPAGPVPKLLPKVNGGRPTALRRKGHLGSPAGATTNRGRPQALRRKGHLGSGAGVMANRGRPAPVPPAGHLSSRVGFNLRAGHHLVSPVSPVSRVGVGRPRVGIRALSLRRRAGTARGTDSRATRRRLLVPAARAGTHPRNSGVGTRPRPDQAGTGRVTGSRPAGAHRRQVAGAHRRRRAAGARPLPVSPAGNAEWAGAQASSRCGR
jgi:hypothetical protein